MSQTSRDRDNNEQSCTNSRKELRRNCSPIGHNNTKHVLCQIRSRHPLEFLETVRWESVPRGSFARTWKLSSRLFSRPDWGCRHLSNSLLKQGNGGGIFVFSCFLTTFQSFFLFHFTLTISIHSMLDTDLLRSLLVLNLPDERINPSYTNN